MKRLFLAFVATFTIGIPLASCGFIDVDTIHPNHKAILYVQEQGIVQGYSDGTFKPNAEINRAEFTKIIMEATYPGQTLPDDCFKDVESKDWFADFVCNAKEKGIVSGYKDGTFQPAANINFAEAAKIINTAYGYEYTKTDIWFEGYVRNLGARSAIPTSINNFSKKITRGEMAEMIYRIKTGTTTKSSATYSQIKDGTVVAVSDVKSNVPLNEIISGGPVKDGIPSIDEPVFVSANKASKFVTDQTLGILLKNGSETKFYPYNILNWHTIVNDTVDGKQLTITYDPLTASAMVFDRTINSQVYDFGTSGKLYQSNLIIYDRQTESYWSQILARAIAGELIDYKLIIYPSSIAKFSQVKNIAGLKVLSTETGYTRDYQSNPYLDYQSKNGLLFPVSNTDDRLSDKTLVFAVEIGGQQKAYVYNDLLEVDTLQDTFNGKTLRISVNPSTNQILVIDSAQNRYTGYTTFWFAWAAQHPNGSLWKIGS